MFIGLHETQSNLTPTADNDTTASEEFPSTYKYPSGFTLRPFKEQAVMLANLLGLELEETLTFAEETIPLLTKHQPDVVEGWLAVPRLSALRDRFFPDASSQIEANYEAIHLMLKLLSHNWNICNLCESITPHTLQPSSRTLEGMTKIGEQQKGDILAVPFQYGYLHKGRSMEMSAYRFQKSEFGLGIFAGLCGAFTHSDRYVQSDELETDFPGDVMDINDYGVYDHGLALGYHASYLYVHSHLRNKARMLYGSVTGFVPECDSNTIA